MSIYDVPLRTLDGKTASLRDHEDKALLLVNVASKCGLTPQYEGLQKLHDTYKGSGFSVLGFPCNQFGGQEPGTPEEIMAFCSATYSIDFPMFHKIDVNGENQHPLYEILTSIPDDEKDEAGDIRWNFEKFVVAPGATSIRRFSPLVTAEDEKLIAAVEAVLPDRKVALDPTEEASSGR